MKSLPISIQDFKVIRTEDYLYVDKTKEFWPLVRKRGVYFLSRPRRFGKSLLMSTLYHFFRGEQELFQGLYVHDKADWKEHGVIRLDFSTIVHGKGIEIFERSIMRVLERQAQGYGIAIQEQDSIALYFEEMIFALYHKYGRGVVILIDEYDKPLIDYWDKQNVVEENREVLKSLFSVLKNLGATLRFVMFTGITKLANLSLSASLNHVKDISLDERHSGILGLTQKDLEEYFEEWITLFLKKRNVSRAEGLRMIRMWYNGYSWDGELRLYNPFAILCLMDELSLGAHWYATGTPSILLKQIQKRGIRISDLEGMKIGRTFLLLGTLDTVSISHLLFQTGYLTVISKSEALTGPIYTLGFPNYEVQMTFLEHVMMHTTTLDMPSFYPNFTDLKEALRAENLKQFLSILKGMLARIPYNLHIARESYYHSIFYIILSMLGLRIQSEVMTDKGRIDSVIELDDKAYIFEFKYGGEGNRLEGLVDRALEQIRNKGYGERYKGTGLKLRYIGIAFSSKEVKGKIIAEE